MPTTDTMKACFASVLLKQTVPVVYTSSQNKRESVRRGWYGLTCRTPTVFCAHISLTFQKKGIPHFSHLLPPPHSAVWREREREREREGEGEGGREREREGEREISTCIYTHIYVKIMTHVKTLKSEEYCHIIIAETPH